MTALFTYLTTGGLFSLKSILMKSLVASAFSTLLAGFSNPKVIFGCIHSSFHSMSVWHLLGFFPYVVLQFSLSFLTGFYINVYNRMNWLFSFFGGKPTPIDPKTVETVIFDETQPFLQHLLVAQNAVKKELEDKLSLLDRKALELKKAEFSVARQQSCLQEKSRDLKNLESELRTKQESQNDEELCLVLEKRALETSKKELDSLKQDILDVKHSYEEKLSELDLTLKSVASESIEKSDEFYQLLSKKCHFFESTLSEKSDEISHLHFSLKESASVIQNLASAFKNKGEGFEVSIDSERFSLAVDSLKSFGEMVNSQSLTSLADCLSHLKSSMNVHVCTDISLEDHVEDELGSSTEFSSPKHGGSFET